MKLYNLTMHQQGALNTMSSEGKLPFDEVEFSPRLYPAVDPADYNELKDIVVKATKNIPPQSCVLIGGLGQFQALISQLPFKLFFADYDSAAKIMKGVISHEPFTRQELFEFENGAE